ncbi:hypothetical protein FBU30_003590 [Linnemannia zychae]|nr:hypothetical protein FBU30_003590 [Linnemannia zychae]
MDPTPLEPHNVWQDVSANGTTIASSESYASIVTNSLSNIDHEDDGANTPTSILGGEDGGSPKRYNVQTIRQKKGRQLASTMTGSDSSDNNSIEDALVEDERLLSPSSATHHERPRSNSSTVVTTLEEVIDGDQNAGNIRKKKTTTTTTRTRTTSNRPPSSGNGKNASETSEHVEAIGKTTPSGAGMTKGGFPSVGLYQGLGRVQAFSAIAFSTFAVVHMVPPILASIGGVDLANKALLWGRVYYQTTGLEELLVSGSLLVHLGTGLCKALIRLIWKIKAYRSKKDSTEAPEKDDVAVTKETSTVTEGSVTKTITTTRTTRTRRIGGGGGGGSASTPGLFPYHRLIGWILAPLVISHMNTMRLVPLDVLGDSSMIDYSFITYLHRVGRSGLYFALVGLLAYHMFGGLPVAYNSLLSLLTSKRLTTQELVASKKWRAWIAGIIAGVALVGTGRIMYASGPIPLSRVYLSVLDM